MAYFRASVGICGKSDGGRASRRTAYVRCTANEEFDFSDKADELQDAGVIIPDGADPKYQDPDLLWNEVEQTETRVNSVYARTLEIAIPDEIPQELHSEFAKQMLGWITEKYDLPLEWAIHKDAGQFRDEDNFHVHATIATRGIGPEGWLKKKDRDFKQLCSKSKATQGKIPVRYEIADRMNAWMQSKGISASVTADPRPDRDLVIKNMPKNVVKAFQRHQAEVAKANLDGKEPPQMAAWLARFIDQHRAQKEAVQEVRAAQEQLETLQQQTSATSKKIEKTTGDTDVRTKETPERDKPEQPKRKPKRSRFIDENGKTILPTSEAEFGDAAIANIESRDKKRPNSSLEGSKDPGRNVRSERKTGEHRLSADGRSRPSRSGEIHGRRNAGGQRPGGDPGSNRNSQSQDGSRRAWTRSFGRHLSKISRVLGSARIRGAAKSLFGKARGLKESIPSTPQTAAPSAMFVMLQTDQGQDAASNFLQAWSQQQQQNQVQAPTPAPVPDHSEPSYGPKPPGMRW